MITLHHVPFSRSFRVLWLLEEMGLEVDLVEYAIADGSMRTTEFMAMSPAGRVPALELDGRVIFESGAITQHLCETYPEHRFGRAAGEADRVEFLEMTGFAETQASLLENLNLQHVFLRDPAMRSPVVLKILAARLAGTLQALEQRLEGREWLLKSGFSAADTMMGYNILAAPYYVKMDGFPNLAGYRARFEARAAFQRAKARDGQQAFYSKDFYAWNDV